MKNLLSRPDVLVLLLVGLIMAVAGLFWTHPPPPKGVPTFREDLVQVELEEILSLYEAQPAQADSLYKGRWVQIGKARWQKIHDDPLLVLSPTGKRAQQLTCTFDRRPDTEDPLEFLTLRGFCEGRIDERIRIVDCEVVPDRFPSPKSP